MTRDEQYAMWSIRELERKIPEMKLRDYFAGCVLSGMGEYLMRNRENFNAIAESCYKLADAMIEVRNEKK